MSVRLKLVRYGMAVAMVGLIPGCSPEASKKAHVADRDTGSAGRSAPFLRLGEKSAEPRKLFDEDIDGETGGLEGPVVERGTGRLVGQPRSAAAVGVSRSDAGDITLNVVDADIRDVVRLILEDGLGVNYVIDPAVTGTITVRTSNPVPAEDVVGILNSVLHLNGAALVEQDGLYKVIPAGRAATAGGRPGSRTTRRAGRSDAGIQVAPLLYADGAQLIELLQPFVADQGAIQLDAARNTLLLIGSPDQVATMSDLIDMFDVDWMEGMSFGLYPLDEVGPSQLAEELDQVFGDPELGVSTGALRFIPIDRLSALLVITAQPTYLDRAEDWIKRLDKAGDGDGEQVFVYSVQNGRAADLASVLGELFDIRSTAVGEPSLLAPDLEPIALGSSLATGGPDEGLLDQADGADQGLGSSSRRPRRDRGARSGGFDRGTGPGGFDPRDLTRGESEGGTRIVADETSNSLLIRATAKEYKKILSALQKLDKQPLQVLLEATIAEVTLEDELSYGVQWFFGSDNSNVAFSEFNNRSVGDIFPSGFTGLLSRGDVRIAIDALDTVSDVNVISSPQILVLDNQTARLEVGDEVPIATRTAQGIDTNDGRIVSTIEQRQTGVILNVTPRVNASGLVVLDIEQEVSDVKRTNSSEIDSPTIAQRRIGTSVAVGSDQTVVLGGLIQDNVEDIELGIPLLKDIPGIGILFGNTTQITSRTELLVLITPKVLTNQQEALDATNELRRRLRSLEPLQDKIRALKADVEPRTDVKIDVDDNDAVEPTVDPEAEKPKAVIGADSPRKNFVVQLASVPEETDAWNVWMSFQQDHADDFRGLRPKIMKADADGSPTYRLRVGPFDGADQATSLCSTLGQVPEDCLVLRQDS